MESTYILPLEHHERPTILKMNNVKVNGETHNNNDNHQQHHHHLADHHHNHHHGDAHSITKDHHGNGGHHITISPAEEDSGGLGMEGLSMKTADMLNPNNLHSPVSEDQRLLPMGSPLMMRRVWTPATTSPTSPVSISRSHSYSKGGSRYRGAAAIRKKRRRAVFKNGECNVLKSKISQRRLRYLQDLFTTFVDTQWRWTLLVFGLSFILSWLLFATVWWLIAFTHGDLDAAHQSDDSDWTPCVVQIHDFTSCFLFSIETQHTIGYGSRSTTEECPEAIFVMCLQSITGVMIQAFMVGIVFAKMTRPKRRTQTLLFSRNAVICQRDGDLCLMFRVGDMRKSHIIGASVRAQLIRSRTTKEGELIPQCQVELKVGTDGGTENLFFIWPMTIVHRIDSTSPFYRYSAADLVERDSRMEVVVILEGTIESTGQTTQARSSYLPSEILWGHRFEPMVEYSKDRQGYEVDYSRFNNTYLVDTPLCSARELAEFYKIQDELGHPADDCVSMRRRVSTDHMHMRSQSPVCPPSPQPEHHLLTI